MSDTKNRSGAPNLDEPEASGVMLQESAIPEPHPPGTEKTQRGLFGRKKRRQDKQSYWSLVLRQYRKNTTAVLAFWFVIVLVFMAIFADFLANDKPIVCTYHGEFYAPVIKEYLVDWGMDSWPAELATVDWKKLDYDMAVFPPIPYAAKTNDLLNSFVPPFDGGDHSHLLGTDQLGRDLLAGLIHGSRISLFIGFVAMGIATIIGLLLGSLAGYYGGWVDILISRLIELFLNFPVLFLVITLAAFASGNMPDQLLIFMVMGVIGLTGWMSIARLARGEVLRVRSMEYVTAADALGFPASRVIMRHVIPNALAPVLVAIAFGIAGAILIEASLSFLGFGVPPTIITWGSMLNEARGNVYAWWLAIFPGLMIFLTVLSYNLIGDGLRDATDPRLKI